MPALSQRSAPTCKLAFDDNYFITMHRSVDHNPYNLDFSKNFTTR